MTLGDTHHEQHSHGADGAPAPLHIAMTSVHTSPLATPGSADAGGLNVVVTNTAQALARAGHRVDLVTRASEAGQPYMHEVMPGVRAFFLPAGPRHPVAKSHTDALITPFTVEFRRWMAERGSGIDLIHSHHWFAGVACLPIAQETGRAHVQSFHSVAAREGHNLADGEPAESSGRVPGEARCVRESDLIIAVSQAEKEMITQRYGTPPCPVTIVHPGVDIDMFRPASSVTSVPDCVTAVTGGRDYVFFAARLQPLKAPDLAIRALAELPAGTRPLLVIAGAASDDFAGYEDHLRAVVTETGMESDVRFIGPLPRTGLAAFLAHAQLLLNPSFSETFGIINVEAAACGTPVVAWDSSGIPESVHGGVTGTLCRSREPREWAGAVRAYLDDPAVRARHGAAGRAFAESRTWDAVARDYVAAYRSLGRQA
ncbi:glycosyltransferase [Actinotignum sanguinis]|uniref:Glycosyltransferase n=3 Tax=Actinomycetaceae TaxID=2049 RepID=A0ABZ0RBC2_9ACTO|nr:glycosyltransferase [Actinotignum sanguinis]WPJ88411.1 glycosyltransferase [Schaalia turicensis]MDE1553525.1 glycosyltransferase [Actinotignum sanguinis]MDE1565523.1 glycosyltransferase [Actinotignum sanguinis]MDE1577674.1 glycosyltransferase [Actinotignum sanguinis]MDE1641620.1 glycosyltransferase [Actinotignum sanguinis]